ncbi:MAG: acyl-phosphate glycerol 3-phosphate acyltransferase [Marinosulfonomonas sp.]|nr:MAG: acyl-phosphate glycerol 3-phosphate acyltransferase [Marinosulfonomonas sp.]
MPDITSTYQMLAIAALAGYLLGSIPFGIVIARVMGLGNLREIGSGNIGATNVLRTGNKTAAALTAMLDAGKGAVALLLARALIGEDAAQIAALAAFLGHLFPIWLRFRGGKGVATFLGILLALYWPLGLAACATWLFSAITMRMSSLAGLMAAGLSPMWTIMLDQGQTLLLGAILTVLIYIRHAANIKRIKAGTEPKIGRKNSAS